MPRINTKDIDNYGGGNGGSFLSLKNDKDTANVRFMLEDKKDLNNFTYVVHNCEIPDAKFGVDVNCLRSYSDPLDKCPLCRAGMKTSIKVFVPIYNEDEEKVQIWTRGRTIISKLEGLMSRYKDFVGHIFEIERNGKAKSTKTTYEIYEQDEDDTTLDDLGDLPEIEGNVVHNYTADDMEYYLEEGEFPPEDDDEDEEEEEPVRRRRSSKSKKSRHSDDEGVRTRRKRRHEEEEDDDEEDIEDVEDDDEEEEERPVRKKSKSKKTKKRRHEDEF